MRLDKFLAEAAGLTRKDAKAVLGKGRVTVNSAVCKSGDRKLSDTDVVMLDGKALSAQEEFLYLMLHKPAGVVSATEDKRDKTVLDVMRECERQGQQNDTVEQAEWMQRVNGEADGMQQKACDAELRKFKLGNRDIAPVGRLDKDTEGLLLLTDDGDLAHRLLSPKRHVNKVYYARVSGKVPEDAAERFAEGIMVGQEYQAMPAGLEVLSYDTGNDVSEVHMTLREGKFHQVKRMCHEIGCEVLYLKRLSMGSLRLDEELLPGEVRRLTEEEVQKLRTDVG